MAENNIKFLVVLVADWQHIPKLGGIPFYFFKVNIHQLGPYFFALIYKEKNYLCGICYNCLNLYFWNMKFSEYLSIVVKDIIGQRCVLENM